MITDPMGPLAAAGMRHGGWDGAGGGGKSIDAPSAGPIIAPMVPEVPKFHKGGKLKKEGVQMIDAEKGETVLPTKGKKRVMELAMKHLDGMKAGLEKKPAKAKKVKPMKSESKSSKKKHHPFKRTTLDHHTDGSITMMHEHDSDPMQNQTSAQPDLAGAMSNMQENLGPAGAGGGAPEQAAAPAPAAPAPAMA